MVYLFVFLLARLSPASSDVVRVKPGDDVILPCRRAGEASIRAVEWTRPDLEPETVLFYRDGRSVKTQQHPSFKDRVQLVDRELKDGDVSLILKNVSSNDAGTYECRVATGGSRRKRAIIKTEPIRIISAGGFRVQQRRRRGGKLRSLLRTGSSFCSGLFSCCCWIGCWLDI
ncbi:programmed cell death 1 ligand 1-like isoform X4 [Micropterus salmoides]|uniref:programmed cell death 1 ligand 1-like isoform X4 n=1 Tax=Micropterus salmoides TaxID=27706 RepID=UPI0018EE0EB1|nr:programmed cell death 1 ligand 1-like isoform X4 [Micropterus salmoides]